MQHCFTSVFRSSARTYRHSISLVLFLISLGCATRGCSKSQSQFQLPLQAITPSYEVTTESIPPEALPSELRADSILVQKSKRRLSIFRKGRVLRRYTIALGLHPVGDKQHKGDFKTPEGLFRIDYHNPESDYHYSLHITYPDEAHRKRAARLKADPGGDIFIHGLPNGLQTSQRKKLAKDWTWGCIAVNNEEIMELANAVPVGTPIKIVP